MAKKTSSSDGARSCMGLTLGLACLIWLLGVIWKFLLGGALLALVGWGTVVLLKRYKETQIRQLGTLMDQISIDYAKWESLSAAGEEAALKMGLEKNLRDNFEDLKLLLGRSKVADDVLKRATDLLQLEKNLSLPATKSKGPVQKQEEPEVQEVHATSDSSSPERAEIVQYAPEIAETYASIMVDHEAILQKIEELEDGQSEELLALHMVDMRKFSDVLDGYLKIKKEPKNYNQAQERLDRAKKALEKFDKKLDISLRLLNENKLRDFEVSLRMMEQEAKE
ncbi:hypothetical protein [Streptococcus marmotae]|uniref:hypothetical protein n=1 Tax=Streptococcus marmotae TaxID=1825069 RepID=UPI0008311EEB|nr:hypothetical protein [Streptococcus marmotae]